MTEWKWYKSSKWPAACDYCRKPISTTEGRWSAKEGEFRFNACTNCVAPPQETPRPGPPPLNATSSVQPKIDSPACPQGSPPANPAPSANPTASKETREDAIERMHAENVLWAKSQYDALKEISEALNGMNAKLLERNRMLRERMDEEAKKA